MREVLCAVGGKAGEAGLGKPFGVQMIPLQAPDAAHGAAGFAGLLFALVKGLGFHPVLS